MITLVRKHPLAIRWFHWINFPILFAMIWSGVLILWANDVYPAQLYQLGYRATHFGKEAEVAPKWLKVPDKIVLYPVGVRPVYFGDDEPSDISATKLEIKTGYRLADGMSWHFTLAWIFGLNGLAYVLYLIFSKEWRHLLPQKRSFIEAIKVAVKDLAFWRRPELAVSGEKYNHAQRIAYSSVGVLGGLMLITGLAIYKPAQLGWLAMLLGGYQTARLEHFVITCLFLLFFGVHVAQVIRAGFNNFRAMITGWEVIKSAPIVEPIVLATPESTIEKDPIVTATTNTASETTNTASELDNSASELEISELESPEATP
jgi:thiosulfate reductase cytochrome b subunit